LYYFLATPVLIPGEFIYIPLVIGVERRVWPPLVLTNYDLAPESLEMYNNGHTIRVTPKPYK
jgi:hypothetical protein